MERLMEYRLLMEFLTLYRPKFCTRRYKVLIQRKKLLSSMSKQEVPVWSIRLGSH